MQEALSPVPPPPPLSVCLVSIGLSRVPVCLILCLFSRLSLATPVCLSIYLCLHICLSVCFSSPVPLPLFLASSHSLLTGTPRGAAERFLAAAATVASRRRARPSLGPPLGVRVCAQGAGVFCRGQSVRDGCHLLPFRFAPPTDLLPPHCPARQSLPPPPASCPQPPSKPIGIGAVSLGAGR